jgi:hypothetical protein
MNVSIEEKKPKLQSVARAIDHKKLKAKLKKKMGMA